MTFEGKIDSPYTVEVEKDMEVLYDCEGRDIRLDLTNLRYISSSGLRLFLNLLKHAREVGSHVEVVGLSGYMQRVFEVTGFTRLFKILQSQT